MSRKICIICNTENVLDNFYKHKDMADGHLNKCKDCCKKQSNDRQLVLQQDSEWLEKELSRQRDKYYRLGYKEKHKPSSEKKKVATKNYRNKYPEKYAAKIASQSIPRILSGSHNHHWSYNESDYKDVIELCAKSHAYIHRHIEYVPNLKVYKRKDDDTILNTRNQHREYAIDLLEQYSI